MTDIPLLERLRLGHTTSGMKMLGEAADAIEAQAKRIAELEHQLKVECDTYLWNRKRMSRRIAMLEYWMEKWFKYGSSPEARRNQMTMTTEIPDCLMREGEDGVLLRIGRKDIRVITDGMRVIKVTAELHRDIEIKYLMNVAGTGDPEHPVLCLAISIFAKNNCHDLASSIR